MKNLQAFSNKNTSEDLFFYCFPGATQDGKKITIIHSQQVNAGGCPRQSRTFFETFQRGENVSNERQ